MGCLKLTYGHEETPTLFLESDGGKNYSTDLQVWVNPDATFEGVGIKTQTQGGPNFYGSPGGGKDFIYDNNNAIGLGIGIWEPAFGAAWDAVRAAPGAYTNGAKVFAKAGGAGLVGLNVALTTYTLVNEYQNGSFNTHSIVNGVVTGIGVGLAVAGLVVSAPAIAIAGAAIGIGYGIAQVAGIDGWIDGNWGFNNKTPK